MKKHVILLLSLAAMLMIGTSLQAKDKVVVIPLSVSKSMNNIVTVAKSGGDFKDLQKAIDSITDAAWDNPYLIVIAPGQYDVEQTITMKDHVSITGSGKDVTTLAGNIASDSLDTAAIIQGASYVELSNITVANGGTQSSSPYTIGIFCDAGTMSVKNVDVTVGWGAVSNFFYAVFNQENSTLHLDDVDATVWGDHSRGVLNNGESTVYLNNVQITVEGEGSMAVRNQGASTAYLTNVKAIADTEGSQSTGLYNTDDSISYVNGSELSGVYSGVRIGSERTRIRNTIISGHVEDTAPSTAQCRVTYKPDFTFISC